MFSKLARGFAISALAAGMASVGAALFTSSPLAVASAATVGGVVSDELASFTFSSAAGAPTVLTWENFDGPNGTNISGTNPDWGPGVWRSLGGTWRIQGNQADSTSSSLGSINVHTPGLVDAAVEITLDRFGSTTFDAGLLFNDNDYSVLILRYQSAANGTLALYNWNGGYTLMSSISNLYPGGIATAPATVTLRARSNGAQVDSFIDGVLAFSYTLSPAEQTIYKSPTHDGYGMWAEFDTTTKFDDFHIDTP